MFEGFIADNYLFLNLTEAIEWCEKVITPFIDKEEYIDDFLCTKSIYDVIDRIKEKIINKRDDDEDILYRYLYNLSNEELSVLYYKNNMEEFIRDHEIIQSLIINIFDDIENLEYVDEKDNDWFGKLPEDYKLDFRGKTQKDWNKFVNKMYFMDPNDPPENIMSYLCELNEYIIKYVYCKYLSFDRIYRLKNFKRRFRAP